MKAPVVISLALFGACLFAPSPLEPGSRHAPDVTRLNNRPLNGSQVAGGGFTVHVDPATGRIVPNQAPPTELSRGLENALSTSSEGLVEVRSPVPGGGVMVHLEGRFQNTITATADTQGNLSTSCTSTPNKQKDAGEKSNTTPAEKREVSENDKGRGKQ